MRYRSTRDTRAPTPETTLGFEETVLAGLAPDGGLFIPVDFPRLPADFLTKWPELSYVDLAGALFRLFIDPAEISDHDLQRLIQESYTKFDSEEVTPVRPLPSPIGGQLFLLELFHGPTFAFKDVALQFLGNLFEFFLERKNRAPVQKHVQITVLGATSGDTGSAAIYGLRGKKDIQCFILHPHGRVSTIQAAQMCTVLDKNIHNVVVDGTFDDCQDLVKVLFRDAAFKEKHQLGAINSINWARILAQIVYYFYSYFSVCKQLGLRPADKPKIQYSVPTGNFGDILAGFYAKQLGLPVHQLIIATNANDILVRFFEQGVYERQQVHSTISPAMDIQISSNFERFLFYVALLCLESSQDPSKHQYAAKQVVDWMSELAINGAIRSFSSKHLTLARSFFAAKRVTDYETFQAIKRYHQNENDMPLDPHTAIGVRAAEDFQVDSELITVCLATAHCAKFTTAVYHALSGNLSHSFNSDPEVERNVLENKVSHSIPIPKAFRGILKKPSRCTRSPATEEAIRMIIEQ